MSMSKTLLLSAAVLAAAITGTVTAQAGADVLIMKPMQGKSFSLGSKYAIAYYVRRPNTCDLTVLLADNASADDVKGAATRLRFDVRSGASARVETPDGSARHFECVNGGAAMRATPAKVLAYNAN